MTEYLRLLNSNQLFDLKPGSACLIQINEPSQSEAFLAKLAKSKPHLVAFADPESERWHDMFDAILVNEKEEKILTTWHTFEPVIDVVDEFYEVDVPYMCDTPPIIVIEVGRGNLIEAARSKAGVGE